MGVTVVVAVWILGLITALLLVAVLIWFGTRIASRISDRMGGIWRGIPAETPGVRRNWIVLSRQQGENPASSWAFGGGADHRLPSSPPLPRGNDCFSDGATQESTIMTIVDTRTPEPKRFISGATGDWEVIIGLEVHAQVLSKAKLFSGASAEFGGEPNAHVSTVDAAMPGMLPRIGLKLSGSKDLVLTLPKKLGDLMGERVEKRLASLAFEIGRTPKVVIG